MNQTKNSPAGNRSAAEILAAAGSMPKWAFIASLITCVLAVSSALYLWVVIFNLTVDGFIALQEFSSAIQTGALIQSGISEQSPTMLTIVGLALFIVVRRKLRKRSL